MTSDPRTIDAVGGAGSANATVSAATASLDGRILTAPHRCFACGTLNENGLQMVLHAADGRCWSELTLDARFEGWEGIAHGGIITTILDEVMAWSLMASDSWGVTAKLSLDFDRPVIIGRPLRAEGWIVEAHRRVSRTAASLIDVGTNERLAAAEATYVAAPAARRAELQARYDVRLVPDDAARP